MPSLTAQLSTHFRFVNPFNNVYILLITQMELGVVLSREGAQPWGFRLIGGTDFKMPLTVVKVLPDSPAERAGLQNGDTVARFGDKITDDLTHDDARLIVDSADLSLRLRVKRGLYDPVLDNYEPIYEDIDQIERADTDQPSQPTEVLDTFQIQQFLDPNQDIFPSKDVTDAPKLSESRSLTASPFALNAKPYRPFSTDPLPQIPPLEDPIILNPNYSDEFGKILDEFDDLKGKYESRFKLPISEQYDPNWEKKEKNRQEKGKKAIEVTEIETKRVCKETVIKTDVYEIISDKKEQMVKEDVAFMKKMKQEIDLDKIEMTATSVVDESIEKAKIVAEQIKKEIDVELSDNTSSEVQSKTMGDSKIYSETKSEFLETSQVSIEKIDKQSEHEDLGIVKRELCTVDNSKESKEISDKVENKIEVKVAKNVEKFEAIDVEDHISDEKKKSIQKEVEEVIEIGTVRRKSKMFDNEDTNIETKVKTNVKAEESAETGKVKRKSMIFDKEETVYDSKIKSDVDTQIGQAKTDIINENIKSVSNKTDKKTFETKVSAQAEHRAYSIGLKTIPNIRGTVHSSYHYHLLLQTFFLHLTDVMVALSRFILTEPVFNKVEKKSESVSTQQMSSTEFETECVSKKSEDFIKVSESKSAEKRVDITDGSFVRKDKIDNAVQEKTRLKGVNEDKRETEVVESTATKSEVKDNNVEIKTHKKAVFGSEMAQLSEKKAEGLTVKMDAVITEFENKTGIEETSEHRTRSRSRSQVVEEVMKESDPLEWLSKVNSLKTQEITEFKTSSTESSSVVESTAAKKEISNVVISAAEKKIDSRHGSRPRSTTPNKQMYVAIVESHVYTNKDTILLDQTDISETSSVVEETIDTESIQTAVSENITKERSEVVKESVSLSKDKRHDDVSIAKHEEAVLQKDEKVYKETNTITMEQINAQAMKTNIQTAVTNIDQVEKPIVKDYKSKIEEVCQKSNEDIEDVKVETIQNDVQSKHTTAFQQETIVELQEDKQLEMKMEEVVQKSNEIIVEKGKVESKQSEIKIQDIIAQQVAEPIVELYESKKVNIKETQEMSAKKEITEVAEKETVEIQEIVNDSLAVEEEYESHGLVELAKEELAVVKEEQTLELDVSADIKVDKTEIKETKPQLESAALKIVKEQVTEIQPSPEILEKEETKVFTIEKSIDMSKGAFVESESKFIDISSSSSLDSIDLKSKSAIQESTFTAKSTKKLESSIIASSISESVQESSFIAKSNAQKLTLRTDIAQKTMLEQQSSVSSDDINNIDTPTPSTVPPTPVTDEYVFKLQIPLPKISGNIIPLDLTPEEEEDIHIAKKKLVPHIETTLESPVLYDPPLPSPPGTKVGSPVYTKPGLRGGNLSYLRKEEILEIERKSTLLASAIDKTIKSIEEYKEQVGMETKKDVELEESTFSSKIEKLVKGESTVAVSKTEVKSKIDEEWTKVDKQVEDSNITLTKLSKLSVEDDKVESKVILMNGDNAKDATENKYAKETNEQFKPENVINGMVNGHSDSIKDDDSFCEPVESRICGEEAVNYAKLSKRNKNLDCTTNGENGTTNVITDVGIVAFNDEGVEIIEEKEDPMKGFRPVVFNPEPNKPRVTGVYIDLPSQETGRPYTTPTGELLGTHQGIVDGLEEATVDEEVAKELGKPGMTEEKIAELISGESEMLREAHVMGVDFNKIKPIVESLKDSEVLKALNEELLKKSKEEKKKNEKKWTTFLQKPKRAVPKVKFGYHAYVVQEEQIVEAPYKVKIVKQPKPKIAPDYKPESFDTGPLPWEERALNEPPPPPVEAEDPILVPEEVPEFLEAVDPLPESEVPDLEDTGIPLPPPKSEEERVEPVPEPVEESHEEPQQEKEPEHPVEENKQEMENRLAEELVSSVQNMVDPNAPIEQQLEQMRAQLRALARLPGLVQRALCALSDQLGHAQESVSIQASQQTSAPVEETRQCVLVTEVTDDDEPTISEETGEVVQKEQNEEIEEVNETVVENVATPRLTQEEMEKLRIEEEEMLEEQRRIEKQKKEMEQIRQDQESRQIKQRPTPRVGKPKPVFGNGDQERPLVLPGGRKWRGPKDAYNDQFIAETLSAQAEMIQGKAMGMSFESDILPYDERINFLKYEKPPVSLDHLQHSDVYKLVHNMDQTPPRRVDMLTPVVAEADYREKCRSISPCAGRAQVQP
nr:titin-like isoform X5 [Plodia interpunctella]